MFLEEGENDGGEIIVHSADTGRAKVYEISVEGGTNNCSQRIIDPASTIYLKTARVRGQNYKVVGILDAADKKIHKR